MRFWQWAGDRRSMRPRRSSLAVHRAAALRRWTGTSRCARAFARFIPTTAGTGSEVTIVSVISDPEAQRKFAIVDNKLVPVAIALDPNLMLGLPPGVTAATGMDALTHAVESYLSTLATPATRAMSSGGYACHRPGLAQSLRRWT